MEFDEAGKYAELGEQGQGPADESSSRPQAAISSPLLATTKASGLHESAYDPTDAAYMSPAADFPPAAASRGATLTCSSEIASASSSTPGTPTRPMGHSLTEGK